MVIVDAYTKYLEVIIVNSTTAKVIIEHLRDTFAKFGLPITLVTDNGPQLRSTEFEDFTKSNGINHKFSAPYHPATNGQVERYVQTLKQSLRKMASEPGDIKLKLCRFLMQLRKVPNSTTGQSPAELMFRGHFRTTIDLVKRDLTDLKNNEAPLKISARQFQVGDTVQARVYGNQACKWRFGTIVGTKGCLHYLINIQGQTHLRHVDQILKTQYNEPTINREIPPVHPSITNDDKPEKINIDNKPQDQIPTDQPILDAEPESVITPAKRESDPPTNETITTKDCEENKTPLRRSQRSRKPPELLNL